MKSNLQGGIFIALGSNLGDPIAQVEKAIEALQSEPSINLLKRSSLYRTEPVGLAGQPDYINAAVEIETTLTPFALLDTLKRIETRCGRVRNGVFWGPRVIDLDLLLYREEEIADRRLQVPHPEIASRRFVLLPLLEIAPQLHLPHLGALEQLLAHAPRYRVERIANESVF